MRFLRQRIGKSWKTIVVLCMAAFLSFSGPYYPPGPPPPAPGFGCAYVPSLVASFCSALLGTSFLSDPAAFSMEWNLGQTDPSYDVLAQLSGGHQFAFSSTRSRISSRAGGHVVSRLSGAVPNIAPEPEGMSNGHVNYLLGNDPAKWITDVPTFEKVRYRGIYPGIDVVYYGHGAHLEFDFIVGPGASPDLIRIQLDGVDSVVPGIHGDLVIRKAGMEFTWKKPRLYQTLQGRRNPVEGRYKQLGDGSFGFEVGAYHPEKPLVIDPEVIFSSYLGRTGAEIGTRVTTDAAGNVYVAGGSYDPQFPVTEGAFRTGSGATDKLNATVSKFRADGGALVFSTYIGGEDTDAGAGIAVDSAGNIYLAGATFSRDFPVTANAFQRMPGTTSREETATGDCFVLKLNAAGNALVYSTFLGGAAPDFCTSLALDSSGNVYVTGAAGSTGFPRTEDAFQTVLRSGYTSPPLDGFIAKVNPSGSALLYSTLFGGNGTDIATAIAIDAAGNAYVTGITNSTAGFPVTAAAFQSRYNQSGPLINPFMFDAFVLKMNPTGSAVVYSTYLGGAGNDQAYGIAVDSQGAAHICGSTDSTDFPVGAQAYQRSLLGSGGQAESSMGSGDGFVAKLNAAGTQLVFSTYLGGTRDDRATGCALDKDGGIHVTGHTLSANFPVSNDARQRTYGGTASHTVKTGDAFYSKLDPSGRALLYSTYFGGSDDDAGMGIAVDSAGAVYIAGATTSVNLPVSAAAAQRIYGGGPIATGPIFFGDAFLVKFGDAPTVVQPPPPPPPSIGSVVSAASAIGGAVAPGEIVNIGGVNLGPATAVIGQTRVLFDAIAAPVLSASGNLVMAIVPYGVAGKSATQIVVEYQGSRSSPLSVPVVATKPALFTTNGIGRGQAVAAHLDGTANSAENPIPANEIVTLQGTGAGLTEPDSVDGLVASEDWPPIAAAVSVKFGDIAAEEIFFAGGVKGKTAGYFQIQLRVPATVPAGTVPVIVTIGTAASQTGVTIVVAEPLQPSGANGRRTLGITRSPAVHIP